MILREYLNYIRIFYYQASELRIVTNGILLLRISDELIETIVNCYVSVDISPYPPTIDAIIDTFKSTLAYVGDVARRFY